MSTNQSIKNPNVSTLGAVKTALPPEAFARIDETDDHLFYAEPRIVTHIDDNAIAAIKEFFDQTLPRNAAILDLMSSAFSHPSRRVSRATYRRIRLERGRTSGQSCS